jgi:predicted MFS family arabinose efflux permease
VEPPALGSAEPPRLRAAGEGDAPEVRRALVATLVARTAINGGSRGPFPFLPAIARGLGVPLETVGLLQGVKVFAGLGAPLLVRPAERFGRRALMLAALVVLLAGCALFAFRPPLALAFVGFALIGVAKVAYDVPMQAWFGDRVPVERRGRVLGITELTWALSLLLVVPVSGLLIPVIGWQAPFLVTGVLAVAGVVAVLALLEPDRPTHHEPRPFRLRSRHAALLAAAAAVWVAAELLFTVYGAWLEDDLGMSVPAIGVFTLLVVTAEFLGEGAVAVLSDRVGLRRSAIGGLVGSAAAYAALGRVGGSLPLAIVVVFVWFACFEVAIVAMIPFVSVLAQESPERLLAWFAVAMTLGRAAGAVIGPRLYQAGGIGVSGQVAAAGTLLAAVLLLAVRTAPAAEARP